MEIKLPKYFGEVMENVIMLSGLVSLLRLSVPTFLLHKINVAATTFSIIYLMYLAFPFQGTVHSISSVKE